MSEELNPITPFDRTPKRLAGYGKEHPSGKWPGGAKVAVSFCLNYEEGGEYSIRNGDAWHQRQFQEYENGVTESVPKVGVVDPAVESQYSYGSRAGVWRIFKAFKDRGMVLCLYGVASALAQSPNVTKKALEYGFECGSHGGRWIQHATIPAEEESAQIAEGLKVWMSQGPAPVGWFYGRPSAESSYLVLEEYKKLGLPPIKWWSDLYSDDVPHWRPRPGGKKDEGMLCLPYSYDNNDYKFSRPNGWRSPKVYGDHLIAAFDELWEEAERTGTDKMMTIGLHCRVIGKPARIGALTRFLDHLKAKGAWVTTREAIA
ncbi:hypothetical protein TREMEDRAFT_35894 [Tremella mesenterica DSM 1558]|uniref:uncharacterized protein n=1 Tax=Tremella mesenterica (strain ATCC 24925 / CBS 8224 / DSM 1558 / NBRC 9311 / NRRL Y-6157 / RJB 2259-6 / UBC 559-6) TaxID=578456 RepID=UPI00032BE7D9|nr:uncharacterized protein TREMEDRAFT_35894 [Tremella mesenterica DSM 1558]EIW65814.1 hypothetical protein TREMEDRAFT_35894 [Tremella mesenterica DSM 1558]